MNSVLAIGGVGGLAVGLAGREILENLFTGLIILSSSPFEVGDEVMFSPSTGPVRTSSIFPVQNLNVEQQLKFAICDGGSLGLKEPPVTDLVLWRIFQPSPGFICPNKPLQASRHIAPRICQCTACMRARSGKRLKKSRHVTVEQDLAS